MLLKKTAPPLGIYSRDINTGAHTKSCTRGCGSVTHQPRCPPVRIQWNNTQQRKRKAPTRTAVRINLKGLPSKRSQSQKIQDQTPSRENSPGGRRGGRRLGDTAQKDQGGAWADGRVSCLGLMVVTQIDRDASTHRTVCIKSQFSCMLIFK